MLFELKISTHNANYILPYDPEKLSQIKILIFSFKNIIYFAEYKKHLPFSFTDYKIHNHERSFAYSGKDYNLFSKFFLFNSTHIY